MPTRREILPFARPTLAAPLVLWMAGAAFAVADGLDRTTLPITEPARAAVA